MTRIRSKQISTFGCLYMNIPEYAINSYRVKKSLSLGLVVMGEDVVCVLAAVVSF